MQFFDIKDIGDVNFNALVKELPGRPSWNPFSTQGEYVTAILKSYKTLEEYGINTALRLSHFLGQGLIETGFLRYKAENLNYSAEGLLKIFPKYFTPEEAKKFARKPEKIANRVYANRMGNGDEASGDGWRYRGRGFFQLTGKNNYTRYGELANVDLVRKPDILEKNLTVSVKVAAAFFGKTGLGEYADRNDIRAVSRGVNRGNPNSKYKAHGEAERIMWTKKVLALVKNPEAVVGAGVAAVTASIAAGLDLGDRGEVVRETQIKLAQLGYAVGVADGIYGRNTRRAVLAFQDEYGLDTTGIVDEETAQALEESLDDTRKTLPIERELATERDLRNAGARDISKTNEVGGAGAVAGTAGAVAAANEVGLVKPVVDAVKNALDSDKDETPTDEVTDTTDATNTTADETTGDTVDAPTDDSADDVVDDTAEDAIDDVTDNTADAATEDDGATTDETDDTTSDASDGIIEDVTDDVMDGDIGESDILDTAEDTVEDVADDVIDDITDATDVIDEAIDSADDASDDVSDSATNTDDVADDTSTSDETTDDLPVDESDISDAPDTSVPDMSDDVVPPSDAIETPLDGQTTTEVAVPPQGDMTPAAETETDFVLMSLMIGVALFGAFVWSRSRGIVNDRVDDYRKGRYT